MDQEREPCDGEEEGASDIAPISIYISRKNVSFKLLAELHIALDRLYRACGGDGLMLVNAETIHVHKQSDSPSDIHAGTEWSNTKTVVERSPFTPDAIAADVHDAICALITDVAIQEKAIASLQQRFPSEVWGKMYPERFALQAMLDAAAEQDAKLP